MAHSPITITEFQTALSTLLKHSGRTGYGKIGLAISGGVDSMALAYLWSQLTNETQPSERFQALIVDHGARPLSRVEAEETRSRLDGLFSRSGAHEKPQIITLKWPDGSPKTRSSGFETRARASRYKAFGEICFRNGIETLLVAHHQDDVVETILSRLAQNHKATGLLGIQEHKPIPDCRGLWGIYESGQFVRAAETKAVSKYMGGPEEGGLTLSRPLLSFPKSRLLATCKAAGVGWIEDSSNLDPTLTMRNSIRRLLNQDVLPLALRRESITRFVQTVNSDLEHFENLANEVYKASHVRFDLRSGVLTVRVPNLLQVFGDEWDKWPVASKRRIASLYLRSLGQCVAAQETVRLPSVEALVDVVFPTDFHNPEREVGELADEGHIGGGHDLNTKKVITREAGGVIFQQRLASEGIIWRVSRRPFSPDSSTDALLPFQIRPNPGGSPKKASEPPKGGKFGLWDGRFWINIRNTGPETVSVVPLLSDLLQRFRNELDRKSRYLLERSLKFTAPGKTRFTLPAIVLLDQTSQELENMGRTSGANDASDTQLKRYIIPGADLERACVIALPTLGIIQPKWRRKLSWDIRYKKLGLEGLREQDKTQMASDRWILSNAQRQAGQDLIIRSHNVPYTVLSKSISSSFTRIPKAR